jgi:hypothetical protein
VTSVAPAGELVKNVLGIDMKEYIGSRTEKPALPLFPGEPSKE